SGNHDRRRRAQSLRAPARSPARRAKEVQPARRKTVASDLLMSPGISETMWKLQEHVGHGRKPYFHPVTWGRQITPRVSAGTVAPALRPRADAWGISGPSVFITLLWAAGPLRQVVNHNLSRIPRHQEI